MGKVMVTVRSDVRASKYPDTKRSPLFRGNPEKPPVVYLEIDGKERLYKIENDRCAEFFSNQRNRIMIIQASGDRDKAAIEFIQDVAAPVQQQPNNGHATAPQNTAQHSTAQHSAPTAATNPPPRPQETPQPEPVNPRQAANVPLAEGLKEPVMPPPRQPNPAETDAIANQHAHLMLVALEKSRVIQRVWHRKTTETLREEELQGMKTSLYLDLVRRGQTQNMPTTEPQ